MSFRRFVRRAAWDAERAREIEAHIAHHVDDLVAGGMSPGDARRAALRKFGNPSVVREAIYDMNSIPILETHWRDARYATRMLRKAVARRAKFDNNTRRTIHELSPRRTARLIVVDCGAIAETLIDSELFGTLVFHSL